MNLGATPNYNGTLSASAPQFTSFNPQVTTISPGFSLGAVGQNFTNFPQVTAPRTQVSTAYPLSVSEGFTSAPQFTAPLSNAGQGNLCYPGNPLNAVSQLSTAEQSYTYNPQVTAPIPGTTAVNLASTPYVNNSTYSQPIPVRVQPPMENGLFTSYFVTSTSPYVNTCPSQIGQ